jgi:hypothetical protein
MIRDLFSPVCLATITTESQPRRDTIDRARTSTDARAAYMEADALRRIIGFDSIRHAGVVTRRCDEDVGLPMISSSGQLQMPLRRHESGKCGRRFGGVNVEPPRFRPTNNVSLVVRELRRRA